MSRPLMTVAVLLASCGSSAVEQRPPPERVPAFLATETRPDIPLLALLLSEDACLSCDAGVVARTIRSLRAAYGERFDFVVFTIGGDRDPVESFLRSERLDARVVGISRDAFAAALGNASLPGVWVVHNGRVENRFHDSPAARWQAVTSGAEDIDDTFARILGPGDAPL